MPRSAGIAFGGAVALLALAAAQHPATLMQTSPGLWEVSGAPGASGPIRECVGDTAALAQFEHREKNCTRVVISDHQASAMIHYTCAGGGFGQSQITLITPRSLRIQTQGISDNLPFNYVIQARRIGDCSMHSSAFH